MKIYANKINIHVFLYLLLNRIRLCIDDNCVCYNSSIIRVNFSLELRKLISFFPVVELIRSVALFPTKANTKMSICLGSQHSPSWSGSECFWTICHRLRFMAPHSSTLAWKIPWLEEPGGLQSMGSLQVEHD